MAWRVLVAENEPALGVVMTKTLCKPIFDVQVCRDAESALVTLRRGKPYDTLISDFTLPGMSGLEFVQAVRSSREFATLPILMVGDHSRMDMETRAKAAGANRFLGKPFTGVHLQAAVTALASNYRPPTAAEQAALRQQAAAENTVVPLDDPTPSSVIRLPSPEMLAEMMRKRPPRKPNP
jgi:DNA-binding response OmpR family regulator